jgi:hypothetical protein
VAVALSEGWYIDGTSLASFGTVIETRDGWDDVPGMRGENTVLLGAHGESWRRKKYGPGTKPLTISVNGVLDDGWSLPATGSARRALYEANLESLLRLLAPRHRLLDVTRVYADGSRRRASCEVTGEITPQTGGDTYGQISLELVVPGAFWEDVDPATYQVPYNIGTGGTQTLEVFSLIGQTAPCADPVVTITGPCTSVTVRDSETGSGFTYATPLVGGDILVLDAGAFTAQLNPAGANTSMLTSVTMYDAQLLEIVPAPQAYRGPTVDVTTAGASSGFTVTFTTKRKWLR